MTSPTDNPRRPARPTRRFSAMQPPVRRRAADKEDAPEAEALADEPAERAAPSPLSVEPPAAEDAALAAGAAPAKPGKAKKPARSATADLAAAPTRSPNAPAAEKSGDEARIAKVMSRAGLCSRRDAEAWILAGRVAVNGAVIASPALNVGPGDVVTVDGYPIEKPEHTRLFMFHKTRGLVTTARDPEGRATIYDALPEELPRLMTIGRLDINTEGLLLMTNDGGLARLLELPATGWLRRYRVRANGRVDQSQLDALAKGVSVDGVDYAGIDARLDRIQGANLWLTLGLREGKNREVKRVLEHLGLAVTRLIRISFGPFQLGDLAENAIEEVRTRILRDQLGTALAKQAGLDFGPSEPDLPTPAPAPTDPRRKTSRSATADRKGRAVPVERIASVTRPKAAAGERAGGRKPAVRAAGPARDDRGADRAPAPRVPRGEGRPRTLRQADAVYGRDAQAPREPREARFERDPRGAGKPGSRREGPRATGERPSRGARSGEERGGEGRFDKAARPRTGRVDERREGGRGDAPRAQKGAAPRAGAPSRRPDGKPPFKGGGARPEGGRPQRPGGGGRGRPRG